MFSFLESVPLRSVIKSLFNSEMNGKVVKSINHFTCALYSLSIVFILSLGTTLVSAQTPKPCAFQIGCKCLVSNSSISCDFGTTDTTIVSTFDTIKDIQTVETFELSDNTNVTKIPNYFSKNISFINIHIRDVQSLIQIDENAFWSSVNTTKSFRLTTSSVNSSESLFKAISKLVYLSELVLDDNQLETIPDNAFGENQKHLTLVVLTRNRIRYLGENVFYPLIFVDYIDLSSNALEKLGNNSFAIRRTNDSDFVHIRINLRLNQITDISDQAFSHLYRATVLDISFNNLTQLRPNVFKTILNYDMTKVTVKGNHIKCDCSLNWIRVNKKIMERFSGPLRCADHRYFNDLTDSDFKNCTSS